MKYEELKTLVSEHKARAVTVLACVIMFVVGFGTGKATKSQPKSESQLDYPNYTIDSEKKPQEVGETAATPAISQGNEKQINPNQPCVIKGNISGNNKIYHVKGGSSYEKTVPEQCFNTETEAEAAGFRKAKR